MSKQSAITKRLKRILILSVEDFDSDYIVSIEYNKLTKIYHVKVKDAFFIQSFNRYNQINEFELLEVYHNGNNILSLYIGVHEAS